jgi:DNA-directed RNA polymerase subunit RPC12/RpoP
MVSSIDEDSRYFKCANPKCGKIFKETYGTLSKANEVICPACMTRINIRAKLSSEFFKQQKQRNLRTLQFDDAAAAPGSVRRPRCIIECG